MFTSAICSIQQYYDRYVHPSKQTSCVILPDELSASLLLCDSKCRVKSRACFNRIGMHVPSFLFRVYLLQSEFERFAHTRQIQYPIPISSDFALHVCNNREPSLRGLNRCVDVKDALLSLLQKGHRFGPASLLPLFNDNETSMHSAEGTRRHLSMDGGKAFPPLFPSTSTRRTLSEEHPLFPTSPFVAMRQTPDDFASDFQLDSSSDFPFPRAVSNDGWQSGLFTFRDAPGRAESGEYALGREDNRGYSPWMTSMDGSRSGLQPRLEELERRRSNSVSCFFPPSSLGGNPSLSANPSLGGNSSRGGNSLITSPLFSLQPQEPLDDFSLSHDSPSNSLFPSSQSPESHPFSSFQTKPRSGSMNPHSAEFIPHSHQTKPRSSSDSDKHTVKRPAKRDLLVDINASCHV